jgi:WD40 repeat protein
MDACIPAFSPDGRWLAIPAAWTDACPFKIGIFNVQTGDLQWEITHKEERYDGAPEALTFAPDGKTLYSVSSELEAWPLTNP